MSEFTRNKTAGLISTFLIGLVILGFIFTGYDQFSKGGSLGSIGTVDGDPITPNEFNQEYNRQIQFYKQIMGEDISAKQLESLNIKESVIKNIVQRKLMIKLSRDIGVFPANEEITAEIKTVPYFLTNNKFDLNRYKAVLAANRLTPTEFEESIAQQIQMKKLQELSTHYPISKGYLEDLEKFRNNKIPMETIQISKSSLSQFVTVTPDELSNFLNVDTNKKRIESMFKEREAGLSRPLETHARHILLMTQGKDEAQVKAQIEKIAKEVTTKNFAALADKYTEDPSGKGKGGDLGYFGKGRMVPEFDQVAFSQEVGTISQPVKTQYGYHLIYVIARNPETKAKLEDFQNILATEIIQKDKVEDIKNLTVTIANSLRKDMEANNANGVKSITDKYKLKLEKGTINQLDGSSTGTNLTAQNMKMIFSADLSKPQFHSFDDGNNLVLIRTSPDIKIDDIKDLAINNPSENSSGLKNALGRKLMDRILKNMEENTSVKVSKASIN